MGRGVDVEMEGGGGLPLSFTLQFSSIAVTVCGGKLRFPLLLFGSSVFWVNHARLSSKSSLRFPSMFSSKLCSIKPGIICKFLIHSGSLQKMLTALFNFASEMFLRIEKF